MKKWIDTKALQTGGVPSRPLKIRPVAPRKSPSIADGEVGSASGKMPVPKTVLRSN